MFKLTQELTYSYNKPEYEKYQVFSPYEGAPVAAYYKQDSLWHRAQIIKIFPEELSAEIVRNEYFLKFISLKVTSLFNKRLTKIKYHNR